MEGYIYIQKRGPAGEDREKERLVEEDDEDEKGDEKDKRRMISGTRRRMAR